MTVLRFFRDPLTVVSLSAIVFGIFIVATLRSRRDDPFLYEGTPFAKERRRTAALLIAFAIVLVGTTALAGFSAMSVPRIIPGVVGTSGTSGILVIDVSGSIQEDHYAVIAHVFSDAIAAGPTKRFGLVLFSDDPSPRLPPNAGQRELRFYRSFFLPKEDGGYPTPPWESRGTEISSALNLASAMLEGEGERAPIVLVSDLADNARDFDALEKTLERFVAEGVDLRIVALSPSLKDRQRFEDILGEEAFREVDFRTFPDAERKPIGQHPLRTSLPYDLIALTVAIGVLLGVNEILFGSRLSLRWR
jgi:hypothetical protein